MNNSILEQSLRCLMAALFMALAAPADAAESAAPRPLRAAHSHNDYEQARPLLDALDAGFCSVEADVWLVDGKLLVAHDLKDARPERTLETLYLEPLLARVKHHGGKVFPGEPGFTLLVDVKSDATNTYRALTAVLERYQSMLTRFSADRTESNAVTVIISGNRARGLMAREPSRLAAYDGRLSDLDAPDARHFIPLISDNWTLHFKWRARPGDGSIPEGERTRLRELVARAHSQGRRLRLWATPDEPAMWKELRDAGVDLINTDKLSALAGFLKNGTSE